MPEVSQIFVYPIKSLSGVSLQSVAITDRGFEYDRRWMLIDAQHRFLTQREIAAMALLQVVIKADGLLVYHKLQPEDYIELPFVHCIDQRIETNIWGVPCNPLLVGPQVDAWFSRMLGIECRLVYMDDDTQVMIDERYNNNGYLTSFSDGFPVLMISEASMADLNSRMENTLNIIRFRPNLVIKNTAPFEEDTMQAFAINEIDFFAVKPSARCVITTIDPNTGEKGREPLKTLSTYRSRNNKIYFGQNVIAGKCGYIKVGDEIVVNERKESLF